MNELTNLEPQDQPPVEAPAPAEPEPQPAEEPTAAAPPDVPPAPDALKGEVETLEKKRKELEERNKKLEADARYWREQEAKEKARAYYEARHSVKPAEQPPAEIPGLGTQPKPSDFQDYDQYVTALTEFQVRKARAQWEFEEARKSRDQELKRRDAELYSKLSDGFQRFEDFGDRVINDPTVPISVTMKEMMHDLDDPAGVAYYLSANRIEAIKISNATPARAAMMMRDIDLKVKNSAPPPAQPNRQKPITGAPPPINPVRSNETVTKDPEKMSQAEYNDWVVKQVARRF